MGGEKHVSVKLKSDQENIGEDQTGEDGQLFGGAPTQLNVIYDSYKLGRNYLTKYIIDDFEGDESKKIKAFISSKALASEPTVATFLKHWKVPGFFEKAAKGDKVDSDIAPVVIQGFHALKKSGGIVAADQDLYDYYKCVPKDIMSIGGFQALDISEEILDPTSTNSTIQSFLKELLFYYDKYHKMLTDEKI